MITPHTNKQTATDKQQNLSKVFHLTKKRMAPRASKQSSSSSSDNEVDKNFNKEDKKAPINVFFSEQGTYETKSKNKDKDHLGSYIIHQNNELHQKLSDLKQKYNDVVVERDFFEQEVDALTKSKTCIQGYMKNELALTESWKYLSETYLEGIKKHKFAWMICLVEYIMATLLVFIFPHTNFGNIMMYLYVPVLAMYNLLKLKQFMYDFEKNTLIVDAKNNITKIDKANMYVLELIDNI